MITTIFVLILVNNDNVFALRTSGTSSDVIVTELGIAIEKIGQVLTVTDDVLISVFVQMPNISDVYNSVTSEAVTREEIHVCNNIKNLETGHFKTVWNDMKSIYEFKINQYIRSRSRLLKPFITPLPVKNDGKGKRSIWSFFGGAALTFFMGGVTEIQIYNLKDHIQTNRKNIAILKNALLTQREQIKQISTQVFAFMQKYTTYTSSVVRRSQCFMFYNSINARMRYTYEDYTRIIDDLIWTAIKGENSLLLTPRMLNLDILEVIVSQNEILQSTIYKDDPNYLYSLAKISLVEVEKYLNYAHFILSAPIVKTEYLKDLYKVSQVGAMIGKNICVYHKTPDYIYESNGQFYPIDLQNCRVHNNLYVCQTSSLDNETSCIQENHNSCEILKQQCSDYYKFHMSGLGILVRNNKDDDTFATSVEGWTSSIKLGPHRTSYLYWANISSLQIGQKRIFSPKTAHVPLIISNLTVDVPTVYSSLSSDNITTVFEEICRKYNRTLQEILNPAFDKMLQLDATTDQKFSNLPEILGLILLSVAVVVLVLWIAYIHYTVRNFKLNPAPAVHFIRRSHDTPRTNNPIYYSEIRECVSDTELTRVN